MLSHVNLGVTDFERALAFYAGVMGELGLVQKFADFEDQSAAWHKADAARPLFIICTPFNGQTQQPGNGVMVAFQTESRATVDRAHAYALAHGGLDEGAPGLRPHYHAHYYGAYFRDLDGNKICVCCHRPE